MGGLPHHGAHHAFPSIPSSRLPQATARIALVLAAHQLPELPQAGSYWAGLRQTAADSAIPLPSLGTNSGSQP
jgi:fatty acid desaturase